VTPGRIDMQRIAKRKWPLCVIRRAVSLRHMDAGGACSRHLWIVGDSPHGITSVLLRRQEPRAARHCGWALGSCLRRSTVRLSPDAPRRRTVYPACRP